MCQICQSLDYNVNKEHLVACYWFKDTERVIIKFCQRKDCEKVLKAKNELRELSKTNLDLGEGSEIFFNQNVCSCYHSFWSRSKKLDSKGKILGWYSFGFHSFEINIIMHLLNTVWVVLLSYFYLNYVLSLFWFCRSGYIRIYCVLLFRKYHSVIIKITMMAVFRKTLIYLK